MARLLEHDAWSILAASWIPLPRWEVVASDFEAASATERLGGRVVLKALVPFGSRGKAGLVRSVSGPQKARMEAKALLASRPSNFVVRQLLVVEHLEIVEEYFASFTFDAACNGPVAILSRTGGVDVERHVRAGVAPLIRRPIDIGRGLRPFEARELAVDAGLRGDVLLQLGDFLPRLYAVFRSCDAYLLEINPLVVTVDGQLKPAAVVIDLDEQAIFRHPEFLAQLTDEVGTGLRPFTPLERRMREIDRSFPDVGAIRFMEFAEGDIGFMVTSGGASLTALGVLVALGGRPANAFDITPGPNEQKIYLATRALLERPGLRGLIAGGNVKNFTRVDTHVRAIVRALRDAGVDPRRFPVVLRFAGPGIEAAREIARSLPGLELYEDETSLEGAVRRIVERTRKPGAA